MSEAHWKKQRRHVPTAYARESGHARGSVRTWYAKVDYPGGAGASFSLEARTPSEAKEIARARAERMLRRGQREGEMSKADVDALLARAPKITVSTRHFLDQGARANRGGKIPLLRRRDALALARNVATKGWTHHESTTGMVEYWAKKVPGGEINITESYSLLGGYDMQHVDTDGHVTKLGRSGGTLSDVKVKAVLEASKKGFAIVNPRKKDPRAPLPNRGKPPKKKWAKGAVKRPGKLGGAGFASRPVAEQRKVLAQCVREYGYRSCLGSLMFIHNMNPSPAVKTRMRGLMTWMRGKYRGSARVRGNPDRGQWEAVPILIGHLHVHVPKMKLTQQQLSVLQMETT